MKSTSVALLVWVASGVVARAQSFDSVALSFAKSPPQLGIPVAGQVPACPLAEPTDIPDGLSPEHFAVVFQGSKALLPDTFRECNLPNFDRAEVRVFSVAAFEAVDKNAAPEFGKLRTALGLGKLEGGGSPPFLLFVDAHPAFVEHAVFQRFQNGRGFGFLTQWMTDSDTIGDALVYLFQGITDDGKSYIVASVPIQSMLPLQPFPEVKNETYDQLEARYAPYAAKATAAFHAAADSDFRPDLGAVRDWIGSMLVK